MNYSPEKKENGHSKANKEEIFTDIPMLIVFLIFIFIMIFIISFAFMYGNPMRIVNGYDSFGNVCGTKNSKIGNLNYTGLDMSEKRYLFFFNVKEVFHSMKICVQKCPTKHLYSKDDLVKFAMETDSFLCRYDIPLNNYKLSDPLNRNDVIDGWHHICPELPVYASTPVLRRCIPRSSELREDVIYNVHAYLNSMDIFQKLFSNFFLSQKMMLILICIAFVFGTAINGFIYLYSYIMPWVISISLFFLSCAVTITLWWTYITSKEQLDNTPINELLEENSRNVQAFLAYSILITVVTVILAFLIWNVKQYYFEVSKLLDCANKYIYEIGWQKFYLQPFLTFLFILSFLIFWYFIMLFIATSNHQSRNDLYFNDWQIHNHTQNGFLGQSLNVTNNQIHEIVSFHYTTYAWVKYSWWYWILALVWISEFILACQQMVIGGTVAQYYFECRNKKLKSPIIKFTRRSLLYHIGSLALGSCLITIFKLPRLLSTVMVNICHSESRCFQKNCTCCKRISNSSWLRQLCIFLSLMNHNAYIIVVMRKVSFIRAAKQAFDIENTFAPAHPSTCIAVISNWVLFFCKCTVTATISLSALVTLKLDPQVHFYALTIFFLCMGTFFVIHCIISVYEIVIDTLILCHHEHSKYLVDDSGIASNASTSLHTFMMELSQSKIDDDNKTEEITEA